MCYDVVMDIDSRTRRQNVRVIISETIMVVTVIITVIILAFLASGYWLSSGFKVERQGMLQIHSTPTGADVEVDGDVLWLQRTNTSKVLASGNHQIVLTKEGYDSWGRTVTISDGLLYRVNYPRLFLINRERLNYYELAKNITLNLPSPNHNYLLLGDDTAVYEILRLNSDQPETTELNLLSLKPSDSITKPSAQLFAETLPVLSWDSDSNLIATLDGAKYNINWRSSEISTLIEKIKPEEEPELPGEIFHFYDEKYGALLDGNILTLYKKSQDAEEVFTAELDFTPDTIKIGGSGGFVFMEADTNVAVLDMEIMTVVRWTLDSSDYGWLDSSMLYAIKDGTLIVYDFDGQNRRELSDGITANSSVIITDNKWLHYLSGGYVVREIIAQ